MNGVKISTLLPPPEKVSTGVGEFEVRGLTLPQIVKLIQQHRVDFARLLVLGSGTEPDYSQVVDLAPVMVSEVIAMAAGVENDAEETEAIKKLPAGVQLIALEKVWTLTVVDPKNFKALLQKVTGGLVQLNLAKSPSSPEKTSVVSLPSKGTS
jgi:hypothetical protein